MYQNCIYIWLQYGLEGLDELVFGDDEVVTQLKDFFGSLGAENVNGAIAVDIAAIDASNNAAIQQQTKLALIQVMMGYFEKLIQAGQTAMQLAPQMPQYAAMVGDVMESARKMFKDLLTVYQIRNADEYLPDLEKYLNAGNSAAFSGGTGGPALPPAGPSGPQGLQAPPRMGPQGPRPSAPGSGSQSGQSSSIPFTG